MYIHYICRGQELKPATAVSGWRYSTTIAVAGAQYARFANMQHDHGSMISTLDIGRPVLGTLIA